MTAPHQGKTSAQHAIQQIPISLQRDFITVVGASHMTLVEKRKRPPNSPCVIQAGTH